MALVREMMIAEQTPEYTLRAKTGRAGEEGQEVFMTWTDGYGGSAALGGSTTGHMDGPFVEINTVYGGQQG